jgi:hypothetical protein
MDWPAAVSADVTESEVDESALEFKRHLLSAAAWMGEKSLVGKLIGEGCNWFDGSYALSIGPLFCVVLIYPSLALCS